MGRVFQFRNLGVYVWNERGSPHHLPHAHIRGRGGRHYASVFLLSLELFNIVEDVGKELIEQLEAQQEDLLAEWERLNGD